MHPTHAAATGFDPNDERVWRVSTSGYSIKVGWGEDKRIIAAYPGVYGPYDEKRHLQWLADAELICDLYNATLNAS